MGVVLALLLAAGSGLPTPAQQQRSAGAVYRVTVVVTASGDFTTALDDEFAVVTFTDDKHGAEGAAFAVDPDGWMLTARHVVDMEQLAREMCGEYRKHYTAVTVREMRMDLALHDIVDNIWPSRFTVTPSDGSSDICTDSGKLGVYRESFWSVAIVKKDDVADLALIKLTQSFGPVATVPFGTMAALYEFNAVYAFGFPDRGGFIRKETGILMRPCEERLTTQPAPELGPDIVRADLERLSRYMMEARPGFSGGPLLAANALVGVTVRAGPTVAEPEKGIASVGLTFAVPVDYVHAWYLWARGLSPKKPTEVCKP